MARSACKGAVQLPLETCPVMRWSPFVKAKFISKASGATPVRDTDPEKYPLMSNLPEKLSELPALRMRPVNLPNGLRVSVK